MITKIDKNQIRKIRARRTRKKLSGTAEQPRLCVFKSLRHIEAQLIDDTKGITLVSVSSLQKEVANKVEGKTKQEAAFYIGQSVAKLAIKKGITNITFDRAGNIYTGRVKAVAEGAREAGLVF